MSEKEKHLEELTEIRKMMERSSKFISLSGMSGVAAGIVALIGSFVAYWYMNVYFRNNSESLVFKKMDIHLEILVFLFLLGSLILMLALASGFFFTYRRAKKKGHSIWDKTAFRAINNLLIPLITGGLFALILIFYREIYIISGVTLIFYGLALVNTSHYTLPDIKFLGIFEILLGLIACIYPGYGVIFWAVGFGVLHIIYGKLMYCKYERNN
jgi:MFS family permease